MKVQENNVGELQFLEEFLRCPTEWSFAAVYRVIGPRVFSYFRARGCDFGLAEDLTQEVMLAVHRKSGTLRNSELFRPWLFKIALNTLLKHLRRQTRRVITTEIVEAHSLHARELDPLRQLYFGEWMAWLEPGERELMMLRYVEGLEYREIASALDLPIGTVQWKIFHSTRKLAARFGAPPE